MNEMPEYENLPAAGALLACADYWTRNRQAGHTRAMMLGAKQDPHTLVVVANHRFGQQLAKEYDWQGRFVSVADFRAGALYGLRAPLVIDHETIRQGVRELALALEKAKEKALRVRALENDLSHAQERVLANASELRFAARRIEELEKSNARMAMALRVLAWAVVPAVIYFYVVTR